MVFTMLDAVGIDIGAARIGLAFGSILEDRVVISDADVVLVDDLETAADDVIAWVAPRSARIVIESSPQIYMPADVTPQAAQRIATAWADCDRLRDMIDTRAKSRGILVKGYTDSRGDSWRSVPRQAWAHRLKPGTSGGITQADARAAIATYLDAASMAHLVGDDRLDAAGALLWALLPPVPRKHGPRDVAPPLTVEQVAEKRAAALVRRKARALVRSRAARGAVPPLAPMPVVNVRRAHACSKCGGPRKGHVRGLPCPPVAA